jgi:hypothetical protein
LDILFGQTSLSSIAIGLDEINLIHGPGIIVELVGFKLLSLCCFHSIKWAVIKGLHFMAAVGREITIIYVI